MQIAGSILVILSGVATFGGAVWLYTKIDSLMLFPEILGFVGIAATYIGIANLRRISKKNSN
jgi:hypothetical protein